MRSANLRKSKDVAAGAKIPPARPTYHRLLESITQLITISIILQKEKSCTRYHNFNSAYNAHFITNIEIYNTQLKKYLHSFYMKNWDLISFTLRYIYR